MGCGDAQGDSQGNAGASTLGAAKSTSAPPSPRSPLPESRAVRGSRFWALADESSDEEDLPEVGSGRRKCSVPLDLARRRSRWGISFLRRGFKCVPASPVRRRGGESDLRPAGGLLGSGELWVFRARDLDLDLPRVG
jgi:hypothetical protein